MAAESIEEVMNEIKKAEEEARAVIADALSYAGNVSDGAAALLEENERKNAAVIKEAERASAKDAAEKAEKEAGEIAKKASAEAEALVKKAEKNLEKAADYVVAFIMGE